MENQEDKGNAPAEPQAPGVVPPRRPSGSGKWIAIIVVLLVVISGLVVLTMYHPTGSSAKIVTAADTATLNEPYNFTLQTNGVYKTVTVYWGDQSSQTFDYQGSNQLTLRHTYTSPGDYLIYYTVDFGGSTYTNAANLVPVHISSTISGISSYTSYGLMQLESNTTSPLVNNTLIFTPGTNLSFIAGYFSAPSDGSHQVVGQNLVVYKNGSVVSETPLAYYYNMNDGQYELSNANSLVNLSFSQGVYSLGLSTTTAVPMTTTDVGTTVSNTTVVSYAKGVTATYGNSTSVNYGTGTFNYTSVPPMLSYLAGTNVTTSGNTNITYGGATVTYTTGANLTLPFSKTITIGAHTNFTIKDGNATIAFLTNGTYANNTGTGQKFNNTTASYVLAGGDYYNFTQATTFQLITTTTSDTTFVLNSDSSFEYDGSTTSTVTMWGTTPVTSSFTKNSSLFYTNPTTSVTYDTASNVTITQLITGVSAPITVGEIDPTQGVYTATYYYDVAALPSAGQYVSPTTGQTFTSAEVAPGGYTTLDPQIAFYTLDSEILINTMMPLVGFNGSSASSFVPMVASEVPSIANGGINANYTNYTFHVRSNLKWQDGSSVTVYDAYYALVRLMLFTNGVPGTGSYLLANYLLPAKFYDNVDYYNITHALTYDNTTQNLTLHFQNPVNPTIVFQLIAASEADPVDANWLIANGAGIQFTPSGFQNYTAFGNIATYNSYIQNHIMADGPYEISYNLPGSQIVLAANPNFVSPGPFMAAPTITTVSLQYLSQPSTAFLELKSGAAQSAIGIPSTPYWPQIQSLSSGASPSLQIKEFPTLGIYFYNFNLNTNTQILKTMVHNENVPTSLFVNPNVRKAFAYAYNYSYYSSTQLGNALYGTNFNSPYAGMLPPGMLFNQTISQLAAYVGYNIPNANGSANSDVGTASMYWHYFEVDNSTGGNVSDGFAANGLSIGSGGTVLYKGSPLVIPIFVPIGDSPDTAGATTWGNVMSQIIPGASFPVVPVTYTQIFATFATPSGNPMPISWGGWAPDYIYPTDYELSMAMPSNLSTYMNPASYNPWFIGGGNSTPTSLLHNPTPNATEVAQTQAMLRAYGNATNATTTAQEKFWFQVVNGFIINQTMEVYLYQANMFWTISSSINGNDIVNYQENLMVGAGQELQYNMLSYNTTS